MKAVLWVCVTTVTLFYSCKERQNGPLADEPAVTQLFSQPEIEDLHRIISFVDSIALEHSDATQMNEVYHDFYDSLVVIMSTTSHDDICMMVYCNYS